MLHLLVLYGRTYGLTIFKERFKSVPEVPYDFRGERFEMEFQDVKGRDLLISIPFRKAKQVEFDLESELNKEFGLYGFKPVAIKAYRVYQY